MIARVWAPDTYVGELGRASVSWLQPAPALVVATTRDYQGMGYLSICMSVSIFYSMSFCHSGILNK